MALTVDDFEAVPALTIANFAIFGLTVDAFAIQTLQVDSFTVAWDNIMFADAEIPQGTVDGINCVFTLQRPPNPAASLQLFVGLLQIQGTDYDLLVNQIIFMQAPGIRLDGTPIAQPIAWYRY